MTKVKRMKNIYFTLTILLIIKILYVSACYHSSMTEYPDFHSSTEKLKTDQLIDYQEMTTLKILSVLTEESEIPCTYDSCYDILEEISKPYQKLADSTKMTVYFSFECCNKIGLWTVLELAAIPYRDGMVSQRIAFIESP